MTAALPAPRSRTSDSRPAPAEQESQAWQETGMTPEEWLATHETRMETIQVTGSYPTLSTLFGDEGFDLELDTLFSFGLERLLDGIAALVENRSRDA
ncbi:TetR/AcrR family transcriptional regulator C-terminal domain-containing protein [Streptomyces sp. NPDC001665]